MKLFIKIFMLVVVLIAGVCITPPKVSAQETSVSFQLFYDQLSPYGSWVDYQNYGYVWIPDVDRDFSPYGTNGQWVFTENGWTWFSNYSWGWAPFHYGRWAYDNFYGWLWVPQNEWGPAWVTWRQSEGYYGWAPMEPGISIEISFGERYHIPNDRWIFVSDRDFNRSDIDRHYINRATNITIINNSRVINNTYIDKSRHTTYVSGPHREDVEKVSGRTVRPVVIRENNRPGQTLNNDNLQIYRPRVQTINNDRKPMPTRVVTLKEVKPVSERKPGNQGRRETMPTNGREQPQRPQTVNPSDRNGRGQQPHVVYPPNRDKRDEQPPRPQTVNPPDKNKRDGRPLGQENAKPSDNMRKGPQPRIIPPDKNKNIEQPPQRQNSKPPDNMGRGQQPRLTPPVEKNKKVDEPVRPPTVTPTDNNRRDEQPLGRQNSKPSDNMRRGQQSPVVNPPDKNKSIEQPPQPQNSKPPDNMGRGQQPRFTPPVEKNKNIDEPQQQRTVKPSNNMRKNQQQRVVPPPVNNRNTDQQAKPINSKPPNNKRQVPQTTPPPNDIK